MSWTFRFEECYFMFQMVPVLQQEAELLLNVCYEVNVLSYKLCKKISLKLH